MRARRFPAVFLASVLAVGLLSACSSLDFLNPFARKGPKMAELTPIQATASLKPAWSYAIGKAGSARFYPAVVGEAVYVAAADGSIARLEDGKPVWRIQAGKPLSGGVGSDGRKVAVGTSTGEVLVFSARDGAPLWQARVSSEVLAPPLVTGELVVVRSGDNRIAAFDSEDGKRKWFYQRPSPTLSLRSSAPMLLADNFILAGFPAGKLVALAIQNGAPVWEGTVALPKGATELDRIADVVAPPVASGPLGCAVAYQGKLTCFDFSHGGNTLWSRDISSSVGLALDNRAVYVTDDNGAIQALAIDSGASLWKQDKLFLRRVSAPLTIGYRHLAVGDTEGIVHLLNREDGAFAARFATDGSPIDVPPQRLGDRILVQTRQGNVFALDVQ